MTNDVALITFVPLALVVLRRAGMEGRMCLVATLMTIAANLGSMFTPVREGTLYSISGFVDASAMVVYILIRPF